MEGEEKRGADQSGQALYKGANSKKTATFAERMSLLNIEEEGLGASNISVGKDTIHRSRDSEADMDEIANAVEEGRRAIALEIQSRGADSPVHASIEAPTYNPLTPVDLTNSVNPVKRIMLSNIARDLDENTLKSFLDGAENVASCEIHKTKSVGKFDTATVEYKNTLAMEAIINKWTGKYIPGISDPNAPQGLKFAEFDSRLNAPPNWAPWIYMEGLDPKVNRTILRAKLSEAGEIAWLEVNMDPRNKFVKGATIKYRYHNSAKCVLAWDGQSIQEITGAGRLLSVKTLNMGWSKTVSQENLNRPRVTEQPATFARPSALTQRAATGMGPPAVTQWPPIGIGSSAVTQWPAAGMGPSTFTQRPAIGAGLSPHSQNWRVRIDNIDPRLPKARVILELDKIEISRSGDWLFSDPSPGSTSSLTTTFHCDSLDTALRFVTTLNNGRRLGGSTVIIARLINQQSNTQTMSPQPLFSPVPSSSPSAGHRRILIQNIKICLDKPATRRFLESYLGPVFQYVVDVDTLQAPDKQSMSVAVTFKSQVPAQQAAVLLRDKTFGSGTTVSKVQMIP